MPSNRRKNKQRWMQAPLLDWREEVPETNNLGDSNGSATSHSVASNELSAPHNTCGREGRAASLVSSPKQMKRTASSLAGGDADEDMANGGGVNANGVTSASPAPSHSSMSSPSESETSPAPGLLTVTNVATATTEMERDIAACASCDRARLPLLNGDEDAERDDAVIAEAIATAGIPATDDAGELFYVELDPESHVMTGVLPEMQRLHVRLTQLVRVLRRRVARLCVLRERARLNGDDVSEVVPASPLLPKHTSAFTTASSVPSCVYRQRDTMTSSSALHNSSSNTQGYAAAGSLPSAEGTLGDVDAIRTSVDSHQSPRQPNPMQDPGGVMSSPRNSIINSRLASARHYTQQQMLDNDSEWCDAGTLRSSRSTTAQSTPSLQPCLPPPSLQFFEEDELDDDGRTSLLTCSSMAARRSYAARFRPESMPPSVQTTPNMLPASTTPYARSDNGGMLSLPPSTSTVGRISLQQQQQQQQLTSPTKPLSVTPTAFGSTTPQLEGSPLLPTPTPAAPESGLSSSTVTPPIMVDDTPPQETWTPLPAGAPRPPPLTEDEKKELRRLSWHVAKLYSRRGLLLQQADRLLCRHAQQHERWEGNEERRGCYRCRRLFSYLTRRHHCRRCGRLCCAECSRYVGKKQDTSYVAAPQDSARAAVGVEHRVIIKSEYTAHIIADDRHELVEERFDEHTYPRRGYGGTGDSPHLQPEQEAEVQDTAPVLDDDDRQLCNPSLEHTADAVDQLHGRPRQHKWVRVCAPCYQNCLRARRNNVLQQLKSANLCILDDGFYYYHVMTTEELCRLSTALNKPDSFKKQVELMSHVVVERSADYVAAAPGYSAHTLTAAAQHTPDVLRTLGSIGVYAFRSARQTANDYVGGYFTASRTILPDNHVGTVAAEHPLSVGHEADVDSTDNVNDDARSEASLVSVEDACNDMQPSLKGGTEDTTDKKTDADSRTDGTCIDDPIDVQT
ncbi:hypothetical protein LPMP_190850 [Leishmania panamensis]|uniref:FYVE-type domain-containing protein n=2 Tax=Leishmania guyanensis species complex TaxID=38579 RepID=A0A088RNB0_LEIPA|nr:hypothetical protein LPMP_190850 [Leishmania panamensis]AIN97428.1 hypothetical protein LPMP_190850 [Leishmania panamensis]